MTLAENGRAAIRWFNLAAVLALFASFGAHGAYVWFGLDARLLFACNFLIILGLALIAVRAHRQSDGDFDSAVAAETIVAFGVLSLILGLATAVLPLLLSADTGLRFDAETLTRLGAPFVQGLAAAGLAPVVAVLVRNFSAEHGRTEGTEEELRQLAMAAGRLTGELGRAKATAAELTKALGDAHDATARLGPDLARHMDEVSDATARLAPALGAGAASLAGAMDQGGRRFADELEQAGGRFAAQLEDARGRMEALGTAAAGGAGELAGVTAELARVRGGAAETAELLEAMGALIDSAERFVAARAAP